MTRIVRGMLFATSVLALTAGTANAQGVGTIFGKVTDPSNAALPGVTVTVAGTALQQPLVVVTANTGAFQFPTVPIGTFTVSFELTGFKKVSRPNVVITAGFNAMLDQKMELGQMSTELTVTAATPVVDTKKTTTGGTFAKELLESIPTARDPWQVINMAPAVQAGMNVGGSASGQQVGLSVYGSSASVQWNLEGGSITDLSSNSSPSYFNFDSFEQIQVVTGGGDVSVQSGGLSINLVTKSGSNVFKGTAVGTFENDAMQGNNISQAQFNASSNGFLSGAPLKKIDVASVEYGGPIMRNRLWFWAAMDRQDINVGILNFFDPTLGDLCKNLVAAQKAGTLSGTVTYANLSQVQACLTNDKTVIKDLEWKFNYQLNSANKFQYLFTADDKYRNHRGASSTTALESTTQQTSDKPFKLPLPTHSITHTLILSDRLVFNNQYTQVWGGFFLDYQDVPPQGTCLQSRYLGSANSADYLTGTRANPACGFNTQRLSNSTTGITSRSLGASYQTVRHTWELKTDATYFMTNLLGGDHSFKFGVGWRKAPILTFSHYSGGGQASVQCVGNNQSNCGTGAFVPVGSATGVVPRSATLLRDNLRNNDWHTYNGYIQDSYSHGKLRLNGGVRYDWQTSKYLGGCVPADVIRPDLLPSQCDVATDGTVNAVTGAGGGTKLQAFSNFAPRVAVTYDLLGNGKTSVHASFSYYYATKITLADALGGLFTQTALTWGTNQSSGACATSATTPCWTDANADGVIQANELIGTPTTSSTRFNTATGILTPAGNIVDPSAQISRTREAIGGIQHELIPNLALGVDYIYRKYDRGTTTFTIGFQPGCATSTTSPCVGVGFPLSQIYTGPFQYTDPITGLTAPYFTVCPTCTRPSGLGSVTMTDPRFQVYKGVVITANKRFSNRWQMNASVTRQTNPSYIPATSVSAIDPTGIVFQNGFSTIQRFIVKVNGSYALPWGISASANLNVNDGGTRTVTINGPGNVQGGLSSTGAATTISKTTLRYQNDGTVRFKPISLLDLGLQKVFAFRGGKNRLKLMFDAFNVFNVNTITSYTSNNLSQTTNFNSPSGVVPPRVFRVGASIAF